MLGIWLATIGSAVCYGLAFPPVAVRALAWIALAPLLVALRRTTGWWTLLLVAWVWTVLASAMTTGWFPRAVAGYFEQPLLIGVALFFAVTTLTAAVYYAAFAVCYRSFASQAAPAIRPLLAGAAWAAVEFGRVELIGRDPWALSGYSQAGVLPLIQIADLTGVYGIAFLLMAVNAALAELWLTRGRESWRGLTAAVACVALALAYGGARLIQPAASEGRATPIAIVQGNLDQGAQWRPDLYGQNLAEYLSLTDQALTAPRRPAVVFWPESAMTFFLDRETLYLQAIGRIVAARSAEVVSGAPRAVGDPPIAYYNTAYLLGANGDIVARYDKQQLLPFAEYFPLPGLDLLRRHFGRVREFTSGTDGQPLPTQAGRAGVVICNEVMFPGIVGDRVRAGSEYLVNLANDTWVGDPQFSAMTFDMVTLRAVEQRRTVVRASTSGPSGIIDPHGRTVLRSAPAARAVVEGGVTTAHGVTVYGRVGDAFALSCAGVVAVTLLRGVRARRSRETSCRPQVVRDYA
jgi:apolipoprotein N-acyltransferase